MHKVWRIASIMAWGLTGSVAASDSQVGTMTAGAATSGAGAGTCGPDSAFEDRVLLAADGNDGDRFGVDMAMSDDRILVGALTGESEGMPGTGSAYLFQRDPSCSFAWTEIRKLTASDAATFDLFGLAVAIDGETAVIGARDNGASGEGSGAAYVFERNEGGPDQWGEVIRLRASDQEVVRRFGTDVAIDGDTIAVSAGSVPGSDPRSTVYVFERATVGPLSWIETAAIRMPSLQGLASFGRSIAISGDILLITEPAHDGAFVSSGAVFVYRRQVGRGAGWTLATELTPSDTREGHRFGHVVAIRGETAVVGTTEDDEGGDFAGAAYIFRRVGDAWHEEAKVRASDSRRLDFFGKSVAVEGDTVVVGANSATYVFRRTPAGGTWHETARLATVDQLGEAVATEGDTIVTTDSLGDLQLGGLFGPGTTYVFSRSRLILVDGFETGDTAIWSPTVP